VVVLSHAFVKEESQVPNEDIDLALMYKEMFVLNPTIHTYVEPEEETDE
jgi:hypothetical protein